MGIRINKLLVSLTFLAFCLGLSAGDAKADSWAPPSTETRESADGRFRFTVEPSPIDSSLEFFREELEAEKEERAVERTPPMGLLEQRQDDGSWRPVWAGPLVNVVAPVSFLIANDGRHVVTFDNWHSVGHGENVIVIYADSGALVRSLSLGELLPQDYIDDLPHSVSSLRWKAGAELSSDSKHLLLDVLVPSLERDGENAVRFSIALDNGFVTPPPATKWQAALEASDTVGRARRAREEARKTYLREPLPAPTSCDTGDWHEYMGEAYHRLTPDWLDMPVAATKILFAPDNSRHKTSVGWLVEAIAEETEFGGDVLIASPCHSDALVAAMREALAPIGSGDLGDTTFYISADLALRAQLEPLIGPSGAKVNWLTPAVAIPQRLERIPGSAEEQAAQEEMQRRQERELEDMLGELGDE